MVSVVEKQLLRSLARRVSLLHEKYYGQPIQFNKFAQKKSKISLVSWYDSTEEDDMLFATAKRTNMSEYESVWYTARYMLRTGERISPHGLVLDLREALKYMNCKNVVPVENNIKYYKKN